MSVLPVGFGSSGGVDTGDIPASLRFRSSASAYLSKTPGSAGDRKKWTLSLWGKVGDITTDAQRFISAGTDANNRTEILISGNKLRFLSTVTSVSRGLVDSTAVFRDPTAHGHLVVALDAANTTVNFYWNNLTLGKTVTTAVANVNHMVSAAVAHNIGRYFGGGNHLDGYCSRICFVDGTALTPDSFGYLNTTTNEWVSKSQSAVKAVVDAGGTNSFMLDFDDATSLTTLGNDYSSKNNDWTLNNFSLTAGTTYDHMLDVPGNSFATLNPIYPSAANITNGNLTSGTTAVRATMNALEYNSKWEVTAGGSAVTAGFIDQNGTTSTTTVTANKTFCFRLATDGTFDYRNVTDSGAWTNISSGLAANAKFWPYGITQAANWNFGQAPLHASATYQSAAGGYFYDTTTGFKALCQRNLPDPTILNPKNGFVAVTATETNIDSTLTAARSWTDYVDIKKNRSNAEAWQWQFSHDSTNEYAVAASSLTRRAKSTNSGADTWVGYSIRIGAAYGTASGYVSHTNGVATTITHNIGVSARQLILLFNRAGGAAVPMYHPDATSGELLDLCTTAADAVSTAITSVGTNSFQIGSATATGTYDYLVCSEISGFFDLGKWTGNASADGAYYDAGHKPVAQWTKAISTTDDHRCYDNLRPGYNVQGGTLLLNTSGAETTTAEMDLTSLGSKARIATTPNAVQTYVTCNWAAVSGKYSLAR